MAQGGPLLLDPERETTNPSGKPGINADTIHEQAQRILSDPLFHYSKRYSDMLKYIVDRTLEGQHDCLKERIIGIEVFERPPDYDTSVDSIVRVAAAEVRKRLSRYYHEAGHDRELRIKLPNRSYVAEFKAPGQPIPDQPIAPIAPNGLLADELLSVREQPIAQERTPAGQPISFGSSSTSYISHIYIWIAVAAGVLVLAGWSMRQVLAPTRAVDKFWAPMLNNSGTTLISIGSPIWITASPQAVIATPGPPQPGITYRQFITHQDNFPIADLTPASAITSFFARRGKDSVIRLSDSTTLSDLHGNPLIVLGSFPNEWALRLGANLPFQFRQDAGGMQWIEDTNHPSGRKWTVSMDLPYEQVSSEYASITRAVDPTTGQWWIGISGVTVMGTIAAQKVMMDPTEMTALITKLPKGWDRKNLQIILEIKMVKGSPGASEVVAAQTW